MRILVIEDEAEIARVLQLELEHEGYSATVARDGNVENEALERCCFSAPCFAIQLNIQFLNDKID